MVEGSPLRLLTAHAVEAIGELLQGEHIPPDDHPHAVVAVAKSRQIRVFPKQGGAKPAAEHGGLGIIAFNYERSLVGAQKRFAGAVVLPPG
mgnify:CR=1 FL=1